MAYASGNYIISEYLKISWIPGSGELTVLCAALLGGSLSFLWYNAHPAEMFMGDTGSLAIGGLVGAIALMVHQPLTLIIVGGIFVMEAGSVILQVASFKSRGKRIFLMSPIHHHFELKRLEGNKSSNSILDSFPIVRTCWTGNIKTSLKCLDLLHI